MGRPSKLSEKQWAEVERRLLEGETPASLAKEYGIDRAALTRKFSQQLRNVKNLAKQIVTVESALRELPVAQQVQVINLAEQLKQMSGHIASAGNDLAIVGKMFAKAAKDATSKIMFQALDDDGETVNPQRLSACTEEIAAVMKSALVANESSKISLNLLNANKETIVQINQVEQKKEKILTRDEFYGRNPAK